MNHFAQAVFWTGVLWLAYVYAGYPLCLWLIGRWKKFEPASQAEFTPKVSVLISARNEEKDIAWKVAETLGWNYPADRLELIVASDASEDRTDEILKNIRDPRLKYVRMDSRVGKNEALNRISEFAAGELLFFTDANSHIGKDCLREMARHFGDPRVGCVTGMEKTLRDGDDEAVATGTQKYLEYEFLITSLESRLGSVLVCDGSIFCIRRELYVPLVPDLANDLELPLHIASKGYAVLCEPSARSLEKATQSSREEFNRKRRISAQGMLGFWRLRHAIRGLRRWQFASRKLLRWLIPIPLAALLISSAFLAARPFFLACLVLQLICYALALVGMIMESSGRRAGGFLAIPYYYLLVHVAAILGVFQTSFGKRFAVWDVAAQSRGREAQRVGVEKI
jgi:poly-beta-1,6-N-acetyl-D-glucosamine synthase